MLNKQPLTLSDRNRWETALHLESSRSSSVSFCTVFIWHRHCPLLLTEVDDCLTMEFSCKKRGLFYLWPIGKGSVRSAVETLIKETGESLCFRYLTQVQASQLETFFPGLFSIEEDRDNADYLYSIESFATLGGKKLHGKRNFCNRFEAAHQWNALPLTRDLFPNCLMLFDRWAEGKEETEDERTALSAAFTHWEDLALEGSVLFCEGSAIAFSIGEKLTDDCFDIHFEKALSDIPGAYPMIARETARQLLKAHPNLKQLNREEDMGIPGLRKAKEDWHPEQLLMKYTAKLK